MDWPQALEAAQTLARVLVQHLSEQPSEGNDCPLLTPSASIVVPETGEMLTPREVNVLKLIARGVSNGAIAEQLVISIHTVKVHAVRILSKLNVQTRTEAALRA